MATSKLVSEVDAALAEEAGVAPTVTIGGKTITLPTTVPIGIAPAAQMGRMDLVFRLLSGGDEEILEHLIMHIATADDLNMVFGAWGLDSGESSASD